MVFNKTYSSGSENQITVESSPRTIYVYPSSSGHYEDSNYHGSVNHGKVHHSRYQAGSYEAEPSRDSQLNTFRPQERHQNIKNDRLKDYADTSDTVSLRKGHSSSVILNKQISEKSKFVHDGIHQHSQDGQPDNSKYHSSRDSPSLHRTFSSQPDQSFEESVAHGTYVLPSSSGQREQRIDGQQDSWKYQQSKSNEVVVHDSFPPNSRDQTFDEITLLGPHVHSGSSPEGNRDEPQEYLKYRKPSNPSLPNHNGFPSIRHDYPFDKNTFMADYETQKGNLKYHSQKPHPSEPNQMDSLSSLHDRPFDQRALMADYETQQEDLKYHSNPIADSNSGTSSNNDDQPSDMSTRSFRATFRHPVYQESRDKDRPITFQSGISSNIPERSPEKSPSHENFAHSTHGSSHEPTRNGQQEDFKDQNTKSSPLADQNRFRTNSPDQSFDESTYRSTYVHPSHGNHKVTRDGQRNLTYHNPNKYHQNHNDLLSNPNSNPFDEGASIADYDTHKGKMKFHSQIINQNVAFDSGISKNIHDQPYDINTSSRATIPIPHYRETHDKVHTDTPSDSKYRSPKNSQSIVFHSGYSSKTHVQSSDPQGSLFYPSQRETHSENQEDLRYTNHPSSSYVNHHNGYQSKTTDQSPDESVIRTVIIQPPYKNNNWEHHEPERIHDDTGSKYTHQYNQGQLPDSESHKDSLDKHQDLNAFQVQKDRFANNPVAVGDQDNTIYHRNDASSKYVPEDSDQHRGYEPHLPVHGPSALHQTEQDIDVSKNHNPQPAKNRPLTNNQLLESRNSHDLAEHNGNSGAHHKYDPYSGPYTRPQVMNDMPNNNEIASVTVEPFGTPKAQPPRGFQLSSFLNSQPPTGHYKTDIRHVQTHSLPEVQQRDSQKDHQNNGYSENEYSQLSPQALYNYSTGARHSQRESPNTNQNEYFSNILMSKTNAGYIRRDSGDQYSSQQNMIPDTHTKSSNDYSYSVPATQHKQGILNAKVPHNSTRKEEIQISPLYPYGGEYVNYTGSNINAYHTGNHHDSTSLVSFKNFSTIPEFIYDGYNSTKSNNLQSISNPQTHTIYQSNGNHGDRYSSEHIGQSGSSQESAMMNYVHQVPVPNSQSAHNNTNSEHLNDAVRPLSNGVYHNGNDHSYSSGRNEDTRTQQGYIAQAHSDASFSNQNHPVSNNPLVNAIKADNFVPVGNIHANTGQQDGSVQKPKYSLVDQLNPGVHHEYAFKLSYNKPKPIPQALRLVPNGNQSEHSAVTPVPQMYAGYLDSRNQRPSGLVGYVDTQHGHAAHVLPYHALPVVKPIVLQSGYQEDTHEISHAKHDHLHVHHSSQSGYQYGIIN